jgi:hypothetical protein
LGLCAGIGACATGDQPPRIDRVEPAQVSQSQATTALIQGSHFYSFASVSLDNKNATHVDSEWGVIIESALEPPTGIRVLNDTSIEIVIPAGLPLGYHDLRVVSPNGDSDTLEDAFIVFDEASIELSIEDAAAGDGKLIEDQKLAIGDTIDLFGVARDESSAFLFDADVSWQVTGSSGKISATQGTSAYYVAGAVGTSTVVASHDLYGQASTGTITVVECLDNAHCVETCRSSNTCENDVCVQGPLDGLCTGMSSATFQEGVNGYAGTVDTSITALAPDFPLGGQLTLAWQQITPSVESAALIRFDDIFGTGPGQVPPGATILGATLITQSLGGSLLDSGRAGAVLVNWDELSTWNSFGGTPGHDPTEYTSFAAAPTSSFDCPCTPHRLDVTESVKSYIGGSPNFGWIFVPGATTIETVASSEDSTVAARPKLEVLYLP